MEKNNAAFDESAPNSLLLRDANIVLPDQVLTRASLLVKNGRILSVLSSDSQQEVNADQTLDLRGLSLFPGFIDLHIHGAMGVDVMQASADDLSRVSRFLFSQGVTGWLPTFVPAADEVYAQAVQAIEGAMKAGSAQPDNAKPSARILGLHYEGPFVNSTRCGALHTQYFKNYSGPADVANLSVPQVTGAIRMMTVAPEIKGGVDLVRELNQRGWIVAIGHTESQIDVLDQALAAGARHMTHFMNAMAPLHHRSPGPVAWGLMRDEVTCDVIADGVHLDPDVLLMLLKLKGMDRLMLISDGIAAAGLGDGAYQIWGETIKVKERRTCNERGSIAGSVITILDAVRMMRSLGVADAAIARLASGNQARLLGIDNDFGSIEEGKYADLVALDQQGNVQLTIVGGRLLLKPTN